MVGTVSAKKVHYLQRLCAKILLFFFQLRHYVKIHIAVSYKS